MSDFGLLLLSPDKKKEIRYVLGNSIFALLHFSSYAPLTTTEMLNYRIP